MEYMNKKYILLDLDGTVIDSREGITESVRYALRQLGIEVQDLRDLYCFIGPPLRDSFCEFYHLSAQEAERAIQDTGNVIVPRESLKIRYMKECRPF